MTTPIVADACPWCYTPPAPDLEAENKRLTAEIADKTARLAHVAGILHSNGADLDAARQEHQRLEARIGELAQQVGEPLVVHPEGCVCAECEPHIHSFVESHRFPVLTAPAQAGIASEGEGSATPQGQVPGANLTESAGGRLTQDAKRRVGRPAAPPRPLPPLPDADVVIHPANNDLLRSLQRAHTIAEYRRQGLTAAAACERAGMKCTYATRVSQGLEAVAAAAIPMDFTRMLPGSGAITMLISHPHLLPKLFATPRATQREVAEWCGAYPSPS